jgi:hypothetical protein
MKISTTPGDRRAWFFFCCGQSIWQDHLTVGGEG